VVEFARERIFGVRGDDPPPGEGTPETSI